MVNERDGIGDETPPDYLTSVRDGGFYGWPYCYWGQTVDDRVPQDAALVAKAIKPDYALGGHTASLGLCWMPAGTLPGFPEGMAIGQHGSWNRSTLSGYKVVFVPFVDGRPAGPARDILSGFLAPDERESYGRPVGVTLGPDGALLVADDVGDVIWRVTGGVTGLSESDRDHAGNRRARSDQDTAAIAVVLFGPDGTTLAATAFAAGATMTEIQPSQAAENTACARMSELDCPLQNIHDHLDPCDHAEQEYHRKDIDIGQEIANQHQLRRDRYPVHVSQHQDHHRDKGDDFSQGQPVQPGCKLHDKHIPQPIAKRRGLVDGPLPPPSIFHRCTSRPNPGYDAF